MGKTEAKEWAELKKLLLGGKQEYREFDLGLEYPIYYGPLDTGEQARIEAAATKGIKSKGDVGIKDGKPDKVAMDLDIGKYTQGEMEVVFEIISCGCSGVNGQPNISVRDIKAWNTISFITLQRLADCIREISGMEPEEGVSKYLTNFRKESRGSEDGVGVEAGVDIEHDGDGEADSASA